jgi:hypothetical protein
MYYGTGNPGPWNPEQRPGDNKWTSGVFARRPDTGEAIWFYQSARTTCTTTTASTRTSWSTCRLAGRARKVLLHPDRNGYVYVMDRTTGQVLSATLRAHHHQPPASTCRPARCKYNPAKEPRAGETTRSICPASPGAKDWQPAAWSPRTRLLYIPHQNLCQDAITYEASYIAGTPFVGADVKMYAGPGRHRGVFTAWDPVAGAQGLGDQGELPGVERRAGHRRRRRVLRHHGRLVQGGRRAQRQAAVAVQDRVRDHRPADQPTAARTAAVRRGAGRRRRLGRRDRLGQARPARRHRRGASSTRCGPAAGHAQGRHALRVRAAGGAKR